jgi:glycosyltransferase involved in cell wall biosynthesis
MPARLKLNYFAPLPPQPTGIGDHTAALAPALASLVDLTLWTEQTGWSSDLAEIAPVRRFDPDAPPVHEMNRADANVFTIGNNATFHRGIFRLARQVPGVVVLHDTRLQHFFASFVAAEPERALYLASIERAHGRQAATAARRWLAGELGFDALVERYPMTTAALDGALAVLVHNPAEFDALRDQMPTPLYLQPLSFPAGPPPRRAADRRPGDPLRLVAFGFIGTNRRIESIVDAIAGMPDPARFTLDVYGQIEDTRLIDKHVARHRLNSRVRRHGYVDEAVLDAALAEADLVLNLRWPSVGEASLSQLRIWRAAAPSLVTRTGWYATLPSDTVFFVEPEAEVETIRRHLAALGRDPAPFQRAGWRGREVLERDHAPAAYAQALVEIAHEAPAHHARRAAIDLARRGTAELLQAMDGAFVAGVAPSVAEAIAALSLRPR